MKIKLWAILAAYSLLISFVVTKPAFANEVNNNQNLQTANGKTQDKVVGQETTDATKNTNNTQDQNSPNENIIPNDEASPDTATGDDDY